MPEKVGSTNAQHLGRQMAEPSGERTHPAFSGTDTASEASAGKFVGEKPDFKVVQTEYDNRLGKTIFKDVGAMWHGTSKNGSDYYTLKIGKLRLLVFPNNKD